MTDINELTAKLKEKAKADINYAFMAVSPSQILALTEALEAAEKRIAELDARTVKLPKRSVGEVMHMSEFSRDYAEGWCSGNDSARHEIQLAGIKLQIEGE